jgi:hypothetical protein
VDVCCFINERGEKKLNKEYQKKSKKINIFRRQIITARNISSE